MRAKIDRRLTDEQREVVAANMGLVYKVAAWYARRGMPLDDLVQVGAIGLARAVQRHDPARGALSTFAVRILRQVMRRAILRNKLIQTPVYHYENPVHQTESRRQFGADALRVSRVLSYDLGGSSIVAAAPDADPDRIEPDELAAVRDAMRFLNDRERDVIVGRYGRGETLESIGDKHGVTKERVRQIATVALGKLRRQLAPVVSESA